MTTRNKTIKAVIVGESEKRTITISLAAHRNLWVRSNHGSIIQSVEQSLLGECSLAFKGIRTSDCEINHAV